ncbi:MAG: hypothetical protein BIFFINMI_03124 [Phycisphaerae bacterium]|nr:hypothetical protein [Phycisphaerae bacterium]
MPAGPLAIVDPESGGGALRLSADSSLRRAYREQWDRYLAHVRAATHAVGGIYACASSDAAWERFILGVLRRLRLAVV